MNRKIIQIDESKCNGCGQCIPNCKEGALKIVNGKAKLVSDVFCDGLGACLGHCPQDAIKIIEREAPAFDEKAVHEHMHATGACPGSKIMNLKRQTSDSVIARSAESASDPVIARSAEGATKQSSQLLNWPIQLRLVPAIAPFLKDADILIAADCVGFAAPSFHQELLAGKVLLVGCPKLDDIQVYRDKITQIVKNNNLKSITYAHMEVPCCTGLISVIKDAIAASGKTIPFHDITIGINGKQL